jgi:DNA (cytosine-5)-methyltransferase 1
MKKFLVADLLCGAGGSTTGAVRAFEQLGLNIEVVCVNHWQTAIDTHRINYPAARHYVQDIATVRPHIIVPEGYLDLLMASPTCTHHSTARGGKPTSDQQRTDPWHIITWLTELRVARIIIENVWEFRNWGPVDPATMRPIKERKGEYFRAWIDVLIRLGFDPEWRKLNAADYGDATTRERFILMARSDGRKLLWPAKSHVPLEKIATPEGQGLKPWRPAKEIIDWSIKGKSIFRRPKPLAPKTLQRIYAGAIRENWPEPFLIILRNNMISRGIKSPVPTISANGTHIALVEPVVVNLKGQSTSRSIKQPLPTQTAHAPHLYVAEPITLSSSSSGVARNSKQPLPTITTGGAGNDKRPGCARPMLVVPTQHKPEAFILSQASGGASRPVRAPVPTITAGGKGSAHSLLIPVTHSKGSNQSRPTSKPMPTITTAKGGEYALAQATESYIDNNGVEYDILFRMLEDHELAGAMGFNTDKETYIFKGTKTQRIKQIGNAVSVRKMMACTTAIMSDEVENVSENGTAQNKKVA